MIIRVVAAAFAGSLVFFGLGYVLFGIVLDPVMKNYMNQFPGFMKEPMPDIIPLYLWNFAMAFLFAFVFEKWANIRTFRAGINGGFILMLLTVLILDLQYLAFTNVWKGYVGLLIDVVAATALGTIAAGVVGLVLGIMNKKAG
ncbi:MAG TPA: hypothetical protein VEV84_12050 [Pyrinomonadaceae bacterium]|nr:hypothetical protein [Pyrinomonadaceae bacterium]